MIVAIVFYQVFGRYVLNSCPTWTENLALVLILYVTLIGAAVGVRDAGHIGMEVAPGAGCPIGCERDRASDPCAGGRCSAPPWPITARSSACRSRPTRSPISDLPEVVRYVPLVLSGVLIVLFSIEHIIALSRGEEVDPSWH